MFEGEYMNRDQLTKANQIAVGLDKNRVIVYIAKLSYAEREKIYNEVRVKVSKAGTRKRKDAKKTRQTQKEIDSIRGQELRKSIEVGTIIKCKGTKDKTGIREVLEIASEGVIARKIKVVKTTHKMKELGLWGTTTSYERDNYITRHQWNKIVKILNIKIIKE